MNTSAAPTRLAHLTTFRVGGTFDKLSQTHSEAEFIDAIKTADAQRVPLLVIGGGSNILASDEHFHGHIVQDVRQEITILDRTGDSVIVEASAGMVWDDFVRWSVEQGFGGVEMLSGIPGTVGACPVQNIGAYGCEVESAIETVKMWDRLAGEIVVKSSAQMGFAYRDSMIKRSTREENTAGEVSGPSGRWIVVSVVFRLCAKGLSAPVRYRELASALGVEAEARVPVAQAREVVLRLRSGKGMVLDQSDHDSWSAGSFFMNPIVNAEVAADLPQDAPRYPAGVRDGVELVKTSAAWLISHAGFEKGYRVRPEAAASLSMKHSLALTNRGGATCEDVIELALSVRTGVAQTFGVWLFPEPVPVGFTWEDCFADSPS